VLSSTPLDRRRIASLPRLLVLAAVTTFLALLAASATPVASAAPRLTRASAQQAAVSVPAALPAPATAATPVTAATAATPATPSVRTALATQPRPSIRSLEVTGTTTRLTVRRVYRSGQVRWINHVVDHSLTALDGCQAERTGPTVRRSTYVASVNAVCSGGPAAMRAEVARLHKSRPWYRLTVSDVPLIGFGLLADLPNGNGEAVPAALAKLPRGGFTFADGDDVSLNYVGKGVTQAQLDAAVAAFAGALGVSADRVAISPLFG
jgi:hypothetical protein